MHTIRVQAKTDHVASLARGTPLAEKAIVMPTDPSADCRLLFHFPSAIESPGSGASAVTT